MDNHTQVLIGQGLSALFTVSMFFLRSWSDRRKENAEREALEIRAKLDRDQRAQEVKERLDQHDADLKSKLEEEKLWIARDVALRWVETSKRLDRVDQNSHDIKKALAENTEVSIKAFNEANHVNDKILAIQAATHEILQEQRSKADKNQQNKIEQTTTDTQQRVKHIEDAVTGE